jgi:hypothetical protein
MSFAVDLFRSLLSLRNDALSLQSLAAQLAQSGDLNRALFAVHPATVVPLDASRDGSLLAELARDCGDRITAWACVAFVGQVALFGHFGAHPPEDQPWIVRQAVLAACASGGTALQLFLADSLHEPWLAADERASLAALAGVQRAPGSPVRQQLPEDESIDADSLLCDATLACLDKSSLGDFRVAPFLGDAERTLVVERVASAFARVDASLAPLLPAVAHACTAILSLWNSGQLRALELSVILSHVAPSERGAAQRALLAAFARFDAGGDDALPRLLSTALQIARRDSAVAATCAIAAAAQEAASLSAAVVAAVCSAVIGPSSHAQSANATESATAAAWAAVDRCRGSDLWRPPLAANESARFLLRACATMWCNGLRLASLICAAGLRDNDPACVRMGADATSRLLDGVSIADLSRSATGGALQRCAAPRDVGQLLSRLLRSGRSATHCDLVATVGLVASLISTAELQTAAAARTVLQLGCAVSSRLRLANVGAVGPLLLCAAAACAATSRPTLDQLSVACERAFALADVPAAPEARVSAASFVSASLEASAPGTLAPFEACVGRVLMATGDVPLSALAELFATLHALGTGAAGGPTEAMPTRETAFASATSAGIAGLQKHRWRDFRRATTHVAGSPEAVVGGWLAQTFVDIVSVEQSELSRARWAELLAACGVSAALLVAWTFAQRRLCHAVTAAQVVTAAQLLAHVDDKALLRFALQAVTVASSQARARARTDELTLLMQFAFPDSRGLDAGAALDSLVASSASARSAFVDTLALEQLLCVLE